MNGTIPDISDLGRAEVPEQGGTMKKSVLILAVVTMAALGGQAGATVNSSGNAWRGADFGWYEPTMTGSASGYLFVYQTASATGVDTSVTPGSEFFASGYVSIYTSAPCYCYTTYQINPQAVSPTALTMDPAMNSIRFVATLSSTISLSFDLTAVRPQGAYNAGPCTMCVNGWYDPSTGAIGASMSNGLSLVRYGYTTTGNAAGTPLTNAGWTSGFTSLGAGVSAVLP